MTTETLGHDPLIGQALGHYRIAEKIGSGGMGVVYRAHDEHLDREVAIKVLPRGTLADDASRRRFRNEAHALSRLNHPNIATVHDFDAQQNLDFLVMEYIPGVTLSDKLAEASLPEKQVLSLGAQLAEGLSAAHEYAIVHRDLKPGNLRLTTEGRLKILDFGLAKLRTSVAVSPASETLSETHALAGTLPYMAPEQVLGGDIDGRTDIYAAGAVLYEMATGQRVFPTVERSQLASAILGGSPRPADSVNPKLSPELSRIIGKCLEREPENRYQSAKELAIDLRRLQSGAQSGVQRTATAARRWSAKAIGLGLLPIGFVIAVLIAFNIGNVRQRLLSRTGAPRIESLAVLPLQNLSQDPEQEYFADGMTEALIAELSQISTLKVISRTSIMHYKHSSKSIPQIAHELDVDGIVEGSVLRFGNQVRITAQLILTSSDTHLWAKNYQKDINNVLGLQSEVAQAIAAEVRAKVTPVERVRLMRPRSVNPEAYELYLKGRYEWNKRTPEAVKKSLDYFRQAIEKDPSYALAYAGQADSYVVLGAYGVLPAKEAYPLAEAAATKALEFDSALGEAHASLAVSKMIFDWDWQDGEREFKRAIDLSPNYAIAYHWYSLYLSAMGRHAEAIAMARKAESLDPLSLIISTELGRVALGSAGLYEQEMQQCKKTLEMEPNFPKAHQCMADCYIRKGMYKEAIAELQKANELSGSSLALVSYIGSTYALAGRRDKAIEILEQLRARSNREFVQPNLVASIYAALGERDQAFVWLEKALEERSTWMFDLRVSPEFDPIRSDPRYENLLRRMNFPP